MTRDEAPLNVITVAVRLVMVNVPLFPEFVNPEVTTFMPTANPSAMNEPMVRVTVLPIPSTARIGAALV